MGIARQDKSTNVRYGDAIDMFLTPPRPARPLGEHALLAVADETAVLDGGVRAWQWGDGPVTLLVHGWGGRGAQFGALIPMLVNAGRRVVAFDAPGHGDSPGERSTITAMADTIAHAAAWAGRVDAIVAHSFGAAAATVALTRGVEASRVAYVAPVFHVSATVERFLSAIGLAGEERARFLVVLRDVNRGSGPEDLDGRVLAPRLRAPLLVVHDRDDREVPHADGVAAAATWPGAHLVTTVGLGHRRVLDDAHVHGILRGFLAGSGAPAIDVLDDTVRIELDLADRELRRAIAFP